MLTTSKENCTGCFACKNSCPKNAISFYRDDEGFMYPSVDESICINCKKCESVCSAINGKTQNKSALQIGYAAYSINTGIRKSSSSGGIFSLLAEQILNEGGVVIGAAMTDDFKNAHHVTVNSFSELSRIQGSKYLQSAVEDTIQKTCQELNKGKKVLFTGTPCQISGLLNSIDADTSNLYTQDIICRGAPSPEIWRHYVEYRERKAGSNIESVFFRNKKRGWKKYSLLLSFTNKKEYIKKFNSDIYMKAFLKDLILRPSCYSCHFRTKNRQSDITLADFWGIENINKEMDDDKGISFVWIHSDKGKELFESIKDKTVCKSVLVDEALKYNSAAISSCIVNKKRAAFFEDIKHDRIEEVLKKYTYSSIIDRVHLKIMRIKEYTKSVFERN